MGPVLWPRSDNAFLPCTLASVMEPTGNFCPGCVPAERGSHGWAEARRNPRAGETVLIAPAWTVLNHRGVWGGLPARQPSCFSPQWVFPPPGTCIRSQTTALTSHVSSCSGDDCSLFPVCVSVPLSSEITDERTFAVEAISALS